ncbi:MAG: type II toxin-antitoxin system RelE/ParE family toxin [Cyclobacteriaceae bacterium]
MKRKPVVWTEKASESLDFFCEYIRKDSPSAAKRVKQEIVRTARQLVDNPEMYQLDEVFADTTLNIRRFFRWGSKLVYQVNEKEIVILDIFHTSTGFFEEE